jgi:hypothetical protein
MEEARAALFEYIEVWYNRVRWQSSINDLRRPADYEMKMLQVLHQEAAA